MHRITIPYPHQRVYSGPDLQGAPTCGQIAAVIAVRIAFFLSFFLKF